MIKILPRWILDHACPVPAGHLPVTHIHILLQGFLPQINSWIKLGEHQSLASAVQIFFMICIFGLFHGLILLPVVLCLLGPIENEDEKVTIISSQSQGILIWDRIVEFEQLYNKL